MARKGRKSKKASQPKKAVNITGYNINGVVKDILNRRNENKFVNSFVSNAISTVGGTVIQMSPVAQGNGEGQRQGLIINATDLDFRAQITHDISPGTAAYHTRFIVFSWKDPTSFPTPVEVLQLAPMTGFTSQNYMAQYQMIQYRNTAKILLDRTFEISTQKPIHWIHKRIKLHNLKIAFLDGTVGSQSKNSLYVLVISGGGSGTDTPQYAINYQLNYNDT